MGILDILLGGAGARGGPRGGSGGGNMTKIGMALIAYMLWRWYQNSRAGGGAAPMPSPGGDRMPREEPPAQLPHGDPLDIPQPRSGSPDDSDFGPLIESTRRMPPTSRGGGARRGDDGGMDGAGGLEDGGGMGGSLGGGLGDILNDILNGGRGMPGGDPGGGFPRGEPGGGYPRGGSRGGGLEDILGDILGGGRGGGFPGSRVAGPQGDPLSALLQGAGIGGLGGLLAGGAGGGMLGDLMRQFDQSGAGDAARSWVSQGENMPVTPQQIETTFGSDIINELADQFGLSKPELLQGLSETLPDVINQLTPDGRLPTEDEMSRWR
jgi:uncharacterized protein YidB (DUF937 family)